MEATKNWWCTKDEGRIDHQKKKRFNKFYLGCMEDLLLSWSQENGYCGINCRVIIKKKLSQNIVDILLKQKVKKNV